MANSSFQFPFFWSFPPYFTLQPIKETRDKQVELWCNLILSYCKSHRLFVIDVQADTPLFHNASIGRRLPPEAQVAVLDELVASGSALWLDARSKRECLILWQKVEDWARSIYGFAKQYGLSDSVMTVDELSHSDDVRGTELQGLHREIVVRALKLLEAQGKARVFRGATPEEEGVKFL